MNVVLTLTDEQLDLIAERVLLRIDAERSEAEPWLTPQQAAEAWGCSRRAVYGRAKRGRVESRNEGRSILVRRR